VRKAETIFDTHLLAATWFRPPVTPRTLLNGSNAPAVQLVLSRDGAHNMAAYRVAGGRVMDEPDSASVRQSADDARYRSPDGLWSWDGQHTPAQIKSSRTSVTPEF